MKKIFILIFSILLAIFSCKTKKVEVIDPPKSEDIIEIHGDLLVYGTDKFNYLGITNPDGTCYKIVGQMEKLLRENYQVQIVKLRGKLLKKDSFLPEFEPFEFVK